MAMDEVVEALDEVEEVLDKVEEDKDDFGDTFPLVLDHVGLGEGLQLVLCKVHFDHVGLLTHPVHWDGLGRGGRGGGGLV